MKRLIGTKKEREEDLGYEISFDGKSILCHHCGRRSFNPNDVAQHYCGHCHIFHDDGRGVTP